jgi:hypothetical protein
MTYTTERAEKEALKLYKRELKCDHQHAIEAYCRDWDLSGISKSLPFAQKVNQTGHVLNLKPTKGKNNETPSVPHSMFPFCVGHSQGTVL